MTDHILGVDISKANLDVHLMPTGETQQFANSTVGFRRLIAWLRERPVSRVVYEPTGPWHRDFERALGKAGLSLSRVNPLQARRFAQALGQKAKTDAIDARILAAMGRGCWTCLAQGHPRSGRLNSENCMRPGRH